MLLSDIHMQSPECDTELLKRDLSLIDDKTYIIGNGDWFDAIVLTDPRYSKVSDKTHTDAIINECIFELRDLFEPYKDRLVGCGIGNHCWTFNKRAGVDPIGILCNLLGEEGKPIKHLGYSAYLRLRFEHESGGQIKTIYYYQHHGWGAGSTTEGYNITKYAKHSRNWKADIHAYGHVHERAFKELPPRISMQPIACQWKTDKEYLVLTGSYLKTLNKEVHPTYAEVKGINPSPLGCSIVCLEITSNGIIITEENK